MEKPKRTNPFRRKADGSKSGGDGRGRKITNEEKKMQLSIESKNKAVAFSLFCETTSNLSSRVRELRKEKRKLVNEFAEDHCDGDKNKVKTRLRLYRHFKERDDSGSDDVVLLSSQLSPFKNVMPFPRQPGFRVLKTQFICRLQTPIFH